VKYDEYAVCLRIPVEEKYYKARIVDDGNIEASEEETAAARTIRIEHVFCSHWHLDRKSTAEWYLGELIMRRDDHSEHSKELPKLFATKEELDNTAPYNEERLRIEKEIMEKTKFPEASIEELLKDSILRWEPMSVRRRKTEFLRDLDRFKKTKYRTIVADTANAYVIKSEPIMGTTYKPGKIILPEDKKAFCPVTEDLRYYDELDECHFTGTFQAPVDESGDIVLSGMCLYEFIPTPGKLFAYR
jgi:hypothetical protein